MKEKENTAPRGAGTRKGATRRKKAGEVWFLYILRCKDGSLYTGVTKDVERRFNMHQAGKASLYTRTRRPVTLLYREVCAGRTQALVRECAVKTFPKRKKEELVAAGEYTKCKNQATAGSVL